MYDSLIAKGFTKRLGIGQHIYCGIIKAGRIDVSIEMNIVDFDFIDLPEIKILNIEEMPRSVSGHISSDNVLCYAVRDTILLDRYQPARSILYVLEQAKSTLETLLHGNPTPEILAELPSYWGGGAYTFIDDPRRLDSAVIAVATWSDGHMLTLAGSSKSRLRTWCGKANAKLKTAFQLPVFHAEVEISPSEKGVDTLGDAVDWMANQNNMSLNLATFRSSEMQQMPGAILVGSNCILGFYAAEPKLITSARKKGGFRKPAIDKLWNAHANNIELTRFVGTLADHRETTERNVNSQAPFTSKKVALIGCGTIGGYLARALVQLGAGLDGKLFLLDPDIVAAGNIGRHALGVQHIGKNKASAIREVLLSEFPDTEIEAAGKGAQHVWDRFAGFDLVIDATGDEQFSNALNARAIDSRGTKRSLPPIVYCAVFGNGEAAQSFLDSGQSDAACYRCLKPDFAGPWRNDPLGGKKRQVEMVLRPCGESTFVPFAVSATFSAVGLAVDHAVATVSSDSTPNLRIVPLGEQKTKNITAKNVPPHVRCPACGAGS